MSSLDGTEPGLNRQPSTPNKSDMVTGTQVFNVLLSIASQSAHQQETKIEAQLGLDPGILIQGVVFLTT